MLRLLLVRKRRALLRVLRPAPGGPLRNSIKLERVSSVTYTTWTDKAVARLSHRPGKRKLASCADLRSCVAIKNSCPNCKTTLRASTWATATRAARVWNARSRKRWNHILSIMSRQMVVLSAILPTRAANSASLDCSGTTKLSRASFEVNLRQVATLT